MLTLNDGRIELWQWDTGRKLTVDADCSQVRFSNKVFGRSIDVDVVGGVAIIPDVLLQTDKELTAWAFVGTAENGYTKISRVFKVNKRNKPADYVFTPADQTTLEEIKEKIDYLESIQDPDAIKDAVEDYLEQNPVEAPVQSVNGKIGAVNLTAEDVGAISKDDLQGATNEALAQAKASGEFDGKDGIDGADGKDGQDGQDGYTPVKGVDYFTPEEVQEIAEQAAEMVEVPNGIDVTGAKVGQTVKVAEVDESGRPIAWEPADLTGDWVSIIDVTLEEAVAAVGANVDVNGNPFSVKEIMWAAKLPKDGSTNSYFAVGPINRFSGAVDGHQSGFNLTSGDFIGFGTVYLVGTSLRYGTSYSGTTEYNGTARAPYGKVLDGFDIGVSELTTIYAGLTNANYQMPVGSIIRVWGR